MILLVLLIMLVFSLVSKMFNPLVSFLQLIGFPIILATVLYYLINPVVNVLERKYKISRIWTILLVFLIVSIILVWIVAGLIPIIQSQINSLINNWSDYWNFAIKDINKILKNPMLKHLKPQFDNFTKNGNAYISKWGKYVANGTIVSFQSIFNEAAQIIIGLITMPFVLFYMLEDGHKFPKYLQKFIPNEKKKLFSDIVSESNQQLSHYIRGQVTVACFVSLMFFIGYTIIGLKFALALAVLAGILNLIPYIGSFIAIVPALLVGLFMSSTMFWWVILVFIVEQTIEGRFLAPLVLGRYMRIHPLMILAILMFSAQIFGLVGVILGIPTYAVLKVIIKYVFLYYKNNFKNKTV